MAKFSKEYRLFLAAARCNALHSSTIYVITSIYALYGFICSFTNIKIILTIDSWKDWWKLITLLLFIYVICFVCCYIANRICKRHLITNISSEHNAYYIYGDILNVPSIENKEINIVIPVNCCFDTTIDNEVISENSLHGQFFKALYENELISERKLHEEIEKSLQRASAPYEIISDKKRGYKKRYCEGSIAEIRAYPNTKHFLLALSHFEGAATQTTLEAYFTALTRLFEHICNRSQGSPVLIPLIGAGLSKTRISENCLFHALVNFIHIYKSSIHCDIYIVLSEKLQIKIPR